MEYSIMQKRKKIFDLTRPNHLTTRFGVISNPRWGQFYLAWRFLLVSTVTKTLWIIGRNITSLTSITIYLVYLSFRYLPRKMPCNGTSPYWLHSKRFVVIFQGKNYSTYFKQEMIEYCMRHLWLLSNIDHISLLARRSWWRRPPRLCIKTAQSYRNRIRHWRRSVYIVCSWRCPMYSNENKRHF